MLWSAEPDNEERAEGQQGERRRFGRTRDVDDSHPTAILRAENAYIRGHADMVKVAWILGVKAAEYARHVQMPIPDWGRCQLREHIGVKKVDIVGCRDFGNGICSYSMGAGSRVLLKCD